MVLCVSYPPVHYYFQGGGGTYSPPAPAAPYYPPAPLPPAAPFQPAQPIQPLGQSGQPNLGEIQGGQSNFGQTGQSNFGQTGQSIVDQGQAGRAFGRGIDSGVNTGVSSFNSGINSGVSGVNSGLNAGSQGINSAFNRGSGPLSSALARPFRQRLPAQPLEPLSAGYYIPGRELPAGGEISAGNAFDSRNEEKLDLTRWDRLSH